MVPSAGSPDVRLSVDYITMFLFNDYPVSVPLYRREKRRAYRGNRFATDFWHTKETNID